MYKHSIILHIYAQAVEEYTAFYKNKLHYRVHRSPTLAFLLTQMSEIIHILQAYFRNISF
jgi:hypothetical protein